MIKEGKAIELTYQDPTLLEEIETVALSFCGYGMNGGLFQSKKTGTMYAIPYRSSLLFYYVKP